MTQGLSLVTGAAGHVGFNIVKLLHQRGTPVRAGIRTLRKRDYLKEFGCEVVESQSRPGNFSNLLTRITRSWPSRHELGIELTPLQDTINDSFAYAKRRFLQPAG